MIDESPAGEEFKRGAARQARRAAGAGRGARLPARAPARLLRRSEPSPAATATTACTPPATWDAHRGRAQGAVSCIYRFQQHGGQRFGAGHLIDVLRGKATEKVAQFGHERLQHLRHRRRPERGAVARRAAPADRARPPARRGRIQHARADRERARGAARRGARCCCARPSATPAAARGAQRARRRRGAASRRRRRSTPPAQARFAALKAWRAEVAREHNLPAYVVFHDATLAEMARSAPAIARRARRRSAASARRSSRPTGARSCGCWKPPEPPWPCSRPTSLASACTRTGCGSAAACRSTATTRCGAGRSPTCDAFWQSVWDYFELQSPTPHTAVLADERMPGARLVPGRAGELRAAGAAPRGRGRTRPACRPS